MTDKLQELKKTLNVFKEVQEELLTSKAVKMVGVEIHELEKQIAELEAQEKQEWQWPIYLPMIDQNGNTALFVPENEMNFQAEVEKHGYKPWWQSIWYFCNPPEWAQWAACDENGEWAFYEVRPKVQDEQWVRQVYSMIFCFFRFIPHPDWRNSLQERPEDVKCY